MVVNFRIMSAIFKKGTNINYSYILIVIIGLFLVIMCVKIYLIKTIKRFIMKLNEIISMRIRQLLTERKMTQYKLEQLSGLTHNTMICIMNARYQSCNLKTLMKIINALNISAKNFFDDPIFELENILLD